MSPYQAPLQYLPKAYLQPSTSAVYILRPIILNTINSIYASATAEEAAETTC